MQLRWGGVFFRAAERRGGVKADHIIIVKSKHSMVLMANGKPLRSYSVALGRSDGAKERQGDHKTPVGQYVIDQKNAQSRFHRMSCPLQLVRASESARFEFSCKLCRQPPSGLCECGKRFLLSTFV